MTMLDLDGDETNTEIIFKMFEDYEVESVSYCIDDSILIKLVLPSASG